jgi:hypothetical protein
MPTPPAAEPPEVAFDVVDGDIHNYFYRRGPIAAHLLATSGTSPRLIVAFPAGNTGIGVWFDKTASAIKLDVDGKVDGVTRGNMHGIKATLTASTDKLAVKFAALGSIRTLRDYTYTGGKPPETEHQVTKKGTAVVLSRTMLDGKHHAELLLEPAAGTTIDAQGNAISLSGTGGKLAVTITALADDAPLTPIAKDQLLKTAPPASADRDLSALAFLSYREKLLAGSWRFLTYFGRDTLLSVRLMLDALRPDVIEAGLGAVIERLAPDGDVAHEEDIGDFASLRHAKDKTPGTDTQAPIYDYKMVDDDLLLAPVLVAYLLDSPDGKARADAFLAQKTSRGETYAQALAHNLDFVLKRAQPFADKPVAKNLVSLRPGIPVGQWRDSEMGLGYGVFAFDVNVALVPAALDAAARLYETKALGTNTAAATKARALAKAWGAAAKLFTVKLTKADAIAKAKAYAAAQKIDHKAALASITGPLEYTALSLDKAGKPIPVMHTDDGFVLLFGSPPAAYLDEVAANIVRPFPAGLHTPVGVVVANAAFVTDKKTRDLFTRDAYHGAVVWSWQQALLAVGLARQLARTDLPVATHDKLVDAQKSLWQVIEAMAAQRTGELWTWTAKDGQIVHRAYGQDSSNADESNAAQLWSTVYLAVHPPEAQ